MAMISAMERDGDVPPAESPSGPWTQAELLCSCIDPLLPHHPPQLSLPLLTIPLLVLLDQKPLPRGAADRIPVCGSYFLFYQFRLHSLPYQSVRLRTNHMF